MVRLRIPGSTYRLQFNRNFGFADAVKIVPHLKELGITDIYASPILKARRGSMHGYDVTDPHQINPELGGWEGFVDLQEAMDKCDMGLLLDIVPNHMAASVQNPWWRDVLRRGQESVYAGFFDINWFPLRHGMAGKILLPVLGTPYGKALENRELSLKADEGGLSVCYHDQCYPVNERTSLRLLANWFEDLGLDDRAGGILAGGEGRAGCFEEVWKYFWPMYQSVSAIREYVKEKIESLNGRKGIPSSFDGLDAILQDQFYRLAYWRLAGEEINYRRFFAVSDLAALRIEDETVFNQVHSLILKMVAEGRVSGLRIDHIDGLRDPAGYLGRIRKLTEEGGNKKVYIVVEKILGEDEQLPEWPVQGTTGYEYLNVLNALFVYKTGVVELNRFYGGLTGSDLEFNDLAYARKKMIMTDLFPGEVRGMAQRLSVLARHDRHARELAFSQLETAIIEMTSCLPVYRTYINSFQVERRDLEYIHRASEDAFKKNPEAGDAISFLKRVLTLDFSCCPGEEQRREWLEFVMRWQQYTGPVMAKGFEDTTLYIYNCLVSLNEVGGNPVEEGASRKVFHRFNTERMDRHPHAMSATSTHDTKRSEDVRARINVLTEIHGAWIQRCLKWHDLIRKKKLIIREQPIPGDNMEYLIYQTIIGIWPPGSEEPGDLAVRLQEYLVKAAREAKVKTSWDDHADDYEEALQKFAGSILEPTGDNEFLQDMRDFQKVTSFFGALVSLAQLFLKIMSPGVPDFYQGVDLWSLSLVDPDNRRPVDFEYRRLQLAALKKKEYEDQECLVRSILENWEDGMVKLYVMYKALQFRNSHRNLFDRGEYIPVESTGRKKDYVCSFIRHEGSDWALTAVPLFAARLQLGVQEPGSELPALNFPLGREVWGDTVIILPQNAPVCWRNILTGEVINTVPDIEPGAGALNLSEVLSTFPIALLEGS